MMNAEIAILTNPSHNAYFALKSANPLMSVAIEMKPAVVLAKLWITAM
jgi:hypothetical protein